MRRTPLHSFRYLILFLLVSSCATTAQAQLIPRLGGNTSNETTNSDKDSNSTSEANVELGEKKSNAFESELEKYESLEQTFREMMPKSLLIDPMTSHVFANNGAHNR